MRKVALHIEHKYKNRLVATHLINSESGMKTIGASKTADIRLLGEEVAGIHASVSYLGDEWVLSDLGSESGTWVNQKPVVEEVVNGPIVVHIGGHQLKATPRLVERDLFAGNPDAHSEGQKEFQQVVLLRHGVMHRSWLMNKGEPLTLDLPKVERLPAVQDLDQWEAEEFGEWTIKRRLVRASPHQTRLKDSINEDWRRPAPLLAALLMVTIVFSVMFLMPQAPDDELKKLTPEVQNQFTRMIFDGKKIRKQKEIAEKLRKNLVGQSKSGLQKAAGGDAGAKLAGGNKATPGAKVVMNLKNAGLGAMIGKVAARASKSALLVEAAGVSPDKGTSGRALGVGGGSALDKLGGGGGGRGSQLAKIGGVGTAGKGGGSTGYKGTGALSLGNVGNAEVGVLEDETEIEGGLDKEAIARVIRSQLGQIRYCYERQLSANPELYGKILVKFTIGSAGAVVAQAIGNSSLNNAMVEGCILRRVAGWQFPQPRGGTNVLVTYPFLFKSTR